jgi:hypothetical protein
MGSRTLSEPVVTKKPIRRQTGIDNDAPRCYLGDTKENLQPNKHHRDFT